MFQYFWPEEVTCEKCQNAGVGATFYMSNEPLYSICKRCDPHARKDAMRFANNLSEEEFANGWEWLDTETSQNPLF